jgi:hypothetical protein
MPHSRARMPHDADSAFMKTGQRLFATTATAFVERDALPWPDGFCYGG